MSGLTQAILGTSQQLTMTSLRYGRRGIEGVLSQSQVEIERLCWEPDANDEDEERYLQVVNQQFRAGV